MSDYRFEKDIETEVGAAMKIFSELDEKLVPLLFKGEHIIVSDAAKACQNYEIGDILDRIILWIYDALLVRLINTRVFLNRTMMNLGRS